MHPQLNVAFLPQKLSNVQKSHRSAITSMKQTHILKNALKTGSRSYLAAQWVKDPALSLQQLRLLLWPRNLHRPQAWPKNKTNKQTKTSTPSKGCVTDDFALMHLHNSETEWPLKCCALGILLLHPHPALLQRKEKADPVSHAHSSFNHVLASFSEVTESVTVNRDGVREHGSWVHTCC